MGWLKKLLGLESGTARAQPHQDVMRDYAAERARVKQAGSVEGKHFTEYVEQLKQLKRDGHYDEAIELLKKLVDATESESRAAGKGWGVAPAYYEHLAIIYRKQKRYDEEVAILQRYAAQPKAPGVGPSKLAERLEKAKQLASKAR